MGVVCAFRHRPSIPEILSSLSPSIFKMSAATPQLRGLLNKQIGKHLKIAIGLSLGAAVAWKVIINDSRKRIYADYYKDYDAQADFERMRNLGLFQSCRPDGEEADE